MPADENSADSRTDHTPDQTPEKLPVPEGPEGADPEEVAAAEGPREEPATPETAEAESSDTGSRPPRAQSPGGEDNGATAAEEAGESAGRKAEKQPGEPGEPALPTGDEGSADTGAAMKGEGEDHGGSERTEQSAGPAEPGRSAAGTTSAATAGGAGTAEGTAVKTKRKRRRLRGFVLWTAAILTLSMCAGVATAYGYYRSLRSDMVQHDIGSLLKEEERPEKINNAVNVLFIGSDGYEEDSPAYGQEFEGERSDSLMLAHISPDKRVSVISFPRDSLVQLPECEAYGQTNGTYGYFGMINTALYHGGPPCVVRTIEKLTDIRIDHFVHLSFASFRDVVDAIGGVDMCIPEPMQDRRAKLDLDAGQQALDGEQALAFVRARYEIGDGGDIGRIDRQQMFLAALADQVTSSDVLTSPSKLNGILQAVARYSATDQELTLDRMVSIAVTMADVDLSDIEFHTVPWYQAPYDPNRVMWNEAESAELFAAVREGRPVPELLAADDAATRQEAPTDTPAPADSEAPEEGGAAPAEEDAAEPSPSARAGEGRDATSNPCQDGLGFGTGEDGW